MNALSGRAVDENETHRQKDRQTDRQAKKELHLEIVEKNINKKEKESFCH